jgi:hypothetical protein
MGYVSDQISCGCGQQCGGGPQQGGGEFQPNWATVTATSGGLYHIEAREAIPTPRWSNLALNRAPTDQQPLSPDLQSRSLDSNLTPAGHKATAALRSISDHPKLG